MTDPNREALRADLAELEYWRQTYAAVMGVRSQVDGATHRQRIAAIRQRAILLTPRPEPAGVDLPQLQRDAAFLHGTAYLLGAYGPTIGEIGYRLAKLHTALAANTGSDTK